MLCSTTKSDLRAQGKCDVSSLLRRTHGGLCGFFLASSGPLLVCHGAAVKLGAPDGLDGGGLGDCVRDVGAPVRAMLLVTYAALPPFPQSIFPQVYAVVSAFQACVFPL